MNEKFERHFPDEHEELPPTRKLLTIIKESDIESLAKWQLSLEELQTTKDKHGHSLLNWAQKIGNQEMLDYLFCQYALDKISDKEEDRCYINEDKFFSDALFTWAIALQQDYKKILYLISEGRWPDTECNTVSQINPELLSEVFDGETLCKVAGAGHLHLLAYLQQQTAIDLNARDFYKGNTPLHYAAHSGHAEVITELVKAGADMNRPNVSGIYPIHCAAANDQLDGIRALIALKPDLLNQHGENGYTPLMWAVKNSHLQTVRYLSQQKGIDLNATIQKPESYMNGRTALHLIPPSKDCSEIVRALVQAGADPTMVDKEGFSPLHVAVQEANSPNLALLKALIGTNPDLLNQCDKNGYTPLMYAATRDNKLPIVQYLLAQDGICLSGRGDTVLHASVNAGCLAITKELIKNKPALLNQVDENGYTPLMCAVKAHNFSMMQFLLMQDNIDLSAAVTKGKDTDKIALELATSEGANILLEHYANHGLPIDKKKLDNREKAKVELFEYIEKRGKEPPYKTSFTFFCFTCNFGFSREQKLTAANALKEVMLGKADVKSLEKYRKELNNGELKRVYSRLKPYLPSDNKTNNPVSHCRIR